jgi:uncharacterized protein YdeI (YjbR/CyaY-like superfamily)
MAMACELRRSKRLQRFLNSLPDSTREQFKHFISSVKTEDTRLRRVQQTIELLTEVMEAELDPPPLIKSAFARNAQARQGWELMPQSLRRQYLIAIFRSRFPDTRARNLEFTLRQCAQYAGRRPSAHKANVET